MSAMHSTSRRDFLKTCLAGAAVVRASSRLGLLLGRRTRRRAREIQSCDRARCQAARRGRHGGFTPDVEPSGSRRAGSFRSGSSERDVEDAGSIRVRGGTEGECTWRTRTLQQPAARRSHLRALAGGGNQGERYCGLGPRHATNWNTSDSMSSTGGNRVQCFGTDRVDYEQELVTYGSVGSRLSKILDATLRMS